ncbi:diguanylate cyclase [Novosphingobium guangzhouense]|uniref:diguanylate cyclase n=2 Tax=Novosphingobium guangzhouense TaxID=1850347 RepID=A0A2K2G798_9SPHN|nr:diguanylate cyclase [Novosphingobium guangzhouense]
MFHESTRRVWWHPAEVLGTAIAYFVCALLALMLTRFDGGIAVVWLAGAVLFARLQVTPRRRWMPIIVLCVPAAICASQLFGFKGWAGVGLPLACIVEAVGAAWLMRRFFPRFGRFQSMREVMTFLIICGFTLPALSAVFAAVIANAARDVGYLTAWRDWYAGHALGFIVFGPPLVLLLRGDVAQWTRTAGPRVQRRTFGLLGLVLLASLAAFGQSRIPLVVVPFLPMIAATFKLGRFGAVASIMIVIPVGLACSLAGLGPTALLTGGMALKLQVLQIYFATIVLLLLPLAAELYARRRIVERLHAAEALHRLVLDRMSDIVLRAGLDGTVRYASPSVERVTGYPATELGGRPLFNLIMPEDLPLVLETRRAVMASPEDSAIVEYRVIQKGGSVVWVESHVRAMVNADGNVSGTISIIREVTERRHFVEDLRQQAMTDPLTGASNRRAFDDALGALVTSPSMGGEAGCLAVFDLDHFKRINDEYGHAAGDAVLVRFVAIVRGAVRDGDLVARLGGEEFAVLLAGLSVEQAHLVCERIRMRLGAVGVDTPSGPVIAATVSVGIAPLSIDSDPERILAAADEALYRAKRGGRNQSAAA